MARAIGKAFRITQKDVKSYGYTEPRSGRSMRPNPGVTAIAAINGRGAYARRPSARSAAQGKTRSQRVNRARSVLSPAGREAFAARMRAAKETTGDTMRHNATPAQIAAARRNIKKAIAARRAMGRSHRRNPESRSTRSAAAKRGWAKRRRSGGHRRNPETRSQRSAASKRGWAHRRHRANGQTAAQRRASLANLRKARAAKRRSSGGHRRNPESRSARSAAAKRGWAKRRGHRANGRRRSPARRTHRANGQTAAQRRASLANLRKARAAVRSKRSRYSRNPESRSKRSAAAKRGWAKRRGHRANGRRRSTHRRHRANGQTAAQRRASLANLRKARAALRTRGGHRRNGHRRNSWYGQSRRHATAARKGWAGRKSHRKNRSHHRRYAANRSRLTGGHKAFRKNEYVATLKAALANGALITAGFAGHRALSNLFNNMVLSKIMGAPATPVTPPTAPAVSGLESLQPYSGIIAGGVTAALGIAATNMLFKDTRTKMFVTGGIAASFMTTVLMAILDRVSPAASATLSGASDSEAARLAAMYGLGAGTSILPEYRPIGEYFSENVSGLGEYFSENVSGLGAYGSNPDLYQAAAGYGAVVDANTNHIDPSSNLDRELTIAEAAAGVGQVYQAAAGFGALPSYEAQAGHMGEYFSESVSGLGAIASLPTRDTWVPGMADGQLWAGVKQVSQPQATNALTSAGVLSSGGSQGVFG